MDIRQKAVSGVKWQTVALVYNTLLSILKYSVLTRLLQKADFGLVAIALMIISFTEIFSQLGMTIGIIHKQDITDKQYSSIFWLNVIASIIMFALLWFCSPLLASFYKEPELGQIIPLLGIEVIFNGFGKMFQTVKTKELEFGFLSKVSIIVSTISFIITFVTAWIGWGVYSLVIGQLVMVFINQGIFVVKGIGQQKILFYFNLKEIKDFVKIGSFQLGSAILDFASSKIDVFLIGRFFGMEDLGIYNIAKELILKPYGIIKSLINSVASSLFAKIQNDKYAVQNNFIKMSTIVCTVAVPIYIAMFVFADTIVRILYAPDFFEVSFFLRIMAFVGIATCVTGFASTLQIAYGRTDLGFKWTLIRIAMYTSILLISSRFSINFVAYGQLFLSIISLFIYWWMIVKPLSQINLISFLKSLKNSLSYALLLTIPFVILVSFVKNIYSQIVLGILYFIFYFLCYYVFQRDFLNSLLNLFHIKNNYD